MVSSAGKAICWDEGEVRAMGRDTMGVRGMTLADDARLLSMSIVRGESDLFVITERGYGKRTPMSEYPNHHRGGQGVFTIAMTDKKGQLAAAKVVNEEEEVIIITEEGILVRTAVAGISQLGRNTQGVRVMDVADKDKVTAVGIADDSEERHQQLAGGEEEGTDQESGEGQEPVESASEEGAEE